MKIVVEDILIETTDIASIRDAGYRMHGFVIHLISGGRIFIGREEVYEMTNSELRCIDDRYIALRKKVEEYWEKDKTYIPTLNL